jgi:hypothetical protein
VTSVDDDQVSIETDAGNVPIQTHRTTAIRFAKSQAEPLTGLRVMIGLSDGSRWLAKSLKSVGKNIELTLSDDNNILVDADQVIALQPFGGRVVYLSDLKPSGYKHIPFLQLAWPYELDRNVSGNQLRVGGIEYVKGLGMYSASRLTFTLDAPYRRFEALIGVDDAAVGRGSVVLRVATDRGDGKSRVDFTSPILRGGEPPVPVSVDLKGAKRISLLVDFGERGNEMDYVDWLDARLVK